MTKTTTKSRPENSKYKNAITEGTAAFPYIVVDYANGEVEFERADGKTKRMPLSIRPHEKNRRYIP